MLQELYDADVNGQVTSCSDLEEAVTNLNKELLYMVDKHAPIKTVQVKQTAKPFISDSTKELVRKKHQAWATYKASRNTADQQLYKDSVKEVKKAVMMDRTKWLEEDLGDMASTKNAWNKARLVLGQSKSSGPTCIKKDDNSLVTNPLQMSNMFANQHSAKLSNLRSKSCTTPTTPPHLRLREWLNQ